MMLESLFGAIEKGLEIWDWYNKGSYGRAFKKIMETIRDEEAKPIENNSDPEFVRDQNLIDHCHSDLMLLLNKFSKEPAPKANGSTPLDKPE